MFVTTIVILVEDSTKIKIFFYKPENIGTESLPLCSIRVGQGMAAIYKYRRKRNRFVDEKNTLMIHRKNF
jgi:hypothetical protein